MRVRTRALIAGPMGVIQAGMVAHVPDEIARGLIEGGYADPIVEVIATTPAVVEPEDEPDSEPAVETGALDDSPEAAVTRRGRPRGRG